MSSIREKWRRDRRTGGHGRQRDMTAWNAMLRRDFCRAGAATLVAAGCTRSPQMNARPIQPVAGLAYAQAHEIYGFQRLLFVSGQVPEDAAGNVPADYRDQYRLAFANVRARLEAAGMTFDNLVKVTIFLADRKYNAESRGLRAEILGERAPALTIVITGIYDEKWLLEIEAVAAG
jgi:enamine deaminase RidA (YjgF/YER057c/UK114 family)